MKEIHCDFETRSTTDLRKVGVYKYVEDPHTDVWCLAWAIDDQPVQLWVPPNLFPEQLRNALKHGAVIRAFNAQFERLIWNRICVPRYGFPALSTDRFYCTQADGFAMGLPGQLEKAVKALRLSIAKDMEGNKLAVRMSRPRSITGDRIVWWDDPERLEKLYEYCKQDVRVEIVVTKATRRLGDDEREVYLLDQAINDRGTFFDSCLARACKDIALEGMARANAIVCTSTGGNVKTITQLAQLQFWLKEQGCDIPNLQKNTVQQYLDTDLSDDVRAALLARSEAGKSSISKIDKAFEVVCRDSRLRGLLQYHAAHTGRWGGRLVQPQNFPRPDVKYPEYYIPYILEGNLPYDLYNCHDNPVAIVSSLLRSLLTAAPGKTLLVGDFSAIEARMLAWLAGQDDLVEAFAAYDRGEGDEVYVIAAKQFNVSRYIGKTVILGAGYGMGGDKFLLMGTESYGINFNKIDPPAGVGIRQNKKGDKWILYHGNNQWDLPSYAHAISHAFIKLYRARYAEIPRFWYAIQDMVIEAVRSPGSVQETGRVKATFRGRNLWIILPSGRPLCYWYPTIVSRKTPWGEHRDAVQVWATHSQTKQWLPTILYGGLIVENIVQALSRDVMVHSMNRVTKRGYPIIVTIHDEVVAEVPEHELNEISFDYFIALISEAPPWADGLPIAVSGWSGKRYRKD